MPRILTGIEHLINRKVAPRAVPFRTPGVCPVRIEDIDQSFALALTFQQLEFPRVSEHLSFNSWETCELSPTLNTLPLILPTELIKPDMPELNSWIQDLEAAEVIAPSVIFYENMPTVFSIVDLLEWLQKLIQPPTIISIDLLTGHSKTLGKSYAKEESKQSDFFEKSPKFVYPIPNAKSLQEIVINTNAYKEYLKKQAPAPRKTDIFDVILPLLYPTHLPNNSLPYVIPRGEKLMEFQLTGINFLRENDSALLADQMGLGKTVQAIMAMRILIREALVSKALVVIPVSLQGTWCSHLIRWAPELRFDFVEGNKDVRNALWKTPANVKLVSYETLREDIENNNIDMNNSNFDLLVMDEIAQKAKNADSQISKAIRQIPAKRRWALTGTPIENRVDDLVSILNHIAPNRLRSTNPTDREIKAIRDDLMLRRTHKSVIEDLLKAGKAIPEIKFDNILIELSDDQRTTYNMAYEKGVIELKEMGERITITHVFALYNKLKQICNFDPKTRKSSKLEWLSDKIDEIQESEEKVIVFSQFVEEGVKPLAEALEHYSPVIYHGGLTTKEKALAESHFSPDSDVNSDRWLMLMSIKAGGMGLNLQRANHVVHFDHWWNPATLDQATARVHRIGQTKGVFATSLIANNTVEQRVQQIIEEKREVFREYIDEGTGEVVLPSLSEEELYGLFGLEPPRRARKSLQDSTGLKFEDKCKRLFEAQGWKVTQTKRSRDGGIDLFASRYSDLGDENIIIQCKNHSRKVDVSIVRELAGVLDTKHNKAILIASGGFTGEAYKFAHDKRIQLIGGDELQTLFQKYGIN